MHWKAPSDLHQWTLLIGIGLQIYLAQLLFIQSCRFAPASLIGPMEYSSAVWASVFGFVIFADLPTRQVVVGGVLVTVSGLALAFGSRRVVHG